MNLVVSGNKRLYKVIDLDNSSVCYCTPKKTLLNNKGPILIGDNVIVENQVIIDVLKRKNELIRPRIANLDLAIVVCSTFEPDFSSFLLDKFLTYLDFCKIPSIIVFTKIDRLNKQELENIEMQVKYYSSIGYRVFKTNKNDINSYNELKNLLKGKIVAFMGQTGAGKSTLTNMIDPSFQRSIGEYSSSLGRGKHQTKEVILLPFDSGYIGDTPGFSSLDLKMVGLKLTDLSKFFPGFNHYLDKCFFNNCLHLHEKNCQVKKAKEENLILEDSYNNYVKLIEEMRKD